MRPLRRVVAGAVAVVAGSVLWSVLVWPPPSWWKTHWPAETAFMAMRAGQLAAVRDSTPRRYRPVPADSMTPWLLRAATAGEDDAFFLHRGIDYRSLREALGYRRSSFAWSDPKDRAELRRALGHAWARRGQLRGASTITQQLAKNLYLSPSRNPLRKLKEAVIAYRLEWALDKRRILELYLDVAELGPNLWGVEAASERYFARAAARLSLEQAALLVAALPHPLSSNPVYRPSATRWRQQLILRRLRGETVVIPQEADDAAPAADTTVVHDTTTMPDSTAPKDTTKAGKDSAAAPVVKPDTAAVPPKQRPAPPGAGPTR